MGKPGGFFKKLKARNKKEANKKRRGTTGASKEERNRKHNQDVDFYTAQRQIAELESLSASSSDVDSTDSEAELANSALGKLRQSLGLTATGKKQEEEREHEEDEEDEDALPPDDDDDDEEEGSELEDDEGEEELDEELDDEDGSSLNGSEAMLEEEDEEEEGDEVDLDDEEENVELDEEEAEDHFGDEEDGDDDEEEDEDHDEDDYQSDEELDQKGLARERKQFLLPSFQWKATRAATVEGVVRADDPWFVKYHAGQCGPVDATPLAVLASHDNNTTVTTKTKKSSKTNAASSGLLQSFESKWRVRASNKAKENVLLVSSSASTSAAARTTDVAASRQKKQAAENEGASSMPPFLHEALWTKWCAYRRTQRPEDPPLTPTEQDYLTLLQSYGDVLDTTRSFDVGPEKMALLCLHMLNHWFKTKAVCTVHDSLLLNQKEKETNSSSAATKKKTKQSGKNFNKRSREDAGGVEEKHNDEADDDEEYRDRGFGKTRFLVLLPLRNIAKRYVMTLVDILQARPQDCRKLAQFDSDFSEMEEAVDKHFKRRPLDYRRQFEGNIDDSFCFGLSLQPDRLHVYSHVLNSDVLICSPLGLRKRMEKAGDLLVALSSIELCMIDEAHVLLMQNWDHVKSTLEYLNQRPTETTSGLSDLSRVFGWAIEGKAARQRQTIVCSDVANSLLTSTFRSFQNNGGRLILEHAEHPGVLSTVASNLRQHFLRFDATSPQTLDDERFRFFVEDVYRRKLFPLMERNVRVILFIPSYFDFVRVRNFLFKECREMYGCISEYTSVKEQRRVLGQFSDLERPLLLMTERFYFLKRYFVKLGEFLCFYSPPVFAKFYPHLVSKLTATSPNAGVMTVFSRYDAQELARLIGTQRAVQCLEREASAFSFVTSN